MRNINLLVEDVAHEDFLTALIKRFADARNVEINIKTSSVRGGHGKVITELRQYLRDLQHNNEDLPDLIIVGSKQKIDSPISVTPIPPRASQQLDRQQHRMFHYLCQYGAWKAQQ